MTRLEARPTFVAQDGRELQFIPLKRSAAPGFSHRVVIDRQPVGFLGNGFKPNAKSAAFYLEQNATKAAAQP